MDTSMPGSASPDEIANSGGWDAGGDAADQAERLAMIMEAEAIKNAIASDGDGEGSLDSLDLPLEDVESMLAMEDADDASDDPLHAGGLRPARWMPAEQAAMHVIGDDVYASDETDAERADPDRDQFDGPIEHLTPEDETLLGIDPYPTD